MRNAIGISQKSSLYLLPERMCTPDPLTSMLSGDREWLIRPLSWVWKDIFFAKAVSQSVHGRLGRLFPDDKICMSLSNGVCWHGSRITGVGGSHATAEMGGWTAQDGGADKQKAPSVFISVTFGRSAPIAFLHAKQTASAAEGQAGKKKKRQKQVSRLRVRCLYSRTHSTEGSGNKVVVRVGRALIKKKKKNWKKKMEKTPQTGVINHVSDALTHSWGSEMKGNG